MAEHHLLADIEVDAAPEIDRVNVEPAILLGLSSSEALWTIGVAFAIWIPIAGVVAAMRSSFPLFILMATSIPRSEERCVGKGSECRWWCDS